MIDQDGANFSRWDGQWATTRSGRARDGGLKASSGYLTTQGAGGSAQSVPSRGVMGAGKLRNQCCRIGRAATAKLKWW